MRSGSHSGGRSGSTDRAQTKNPQRDRGHCPNILYIVGIGPGHVGHLSGRAAEVLKKADVIVGYTAYVDLIRPLVGEKEYLSTAMQKEVERVEAALHMALEGKACAVVSSGDAGIYAMAGLVFEMCRVREIPITAAGNDPGKSAERPALMIEVVPGIPALCAGAALLGAPLTHDFAAVSLSDLLTPWEKIEKRLEAAAMADFVIALYNPKSKKRDWQLEAAQKIVLRWRDGDTPVGIVSRAMREGQALRIVPLRQLHRAPVDMQTTVFIGNSTTFTYHDFMITPRGYAEKYAMDKSKPERGNKDRTSFK